MTEQRLVRLSDTEVSANGDKDMTIEGYAVKFNSVTRIGGKCGFNEVVERGVLTGADLSEAILSKNHENDPFACVANGSLTIFEDEVGIKVRAEILNTTAGRDFYESIKTGLISRMSWRASVRDENWMLAADGTELRTIKRFGRMLDVSVVAFPVYKDTSVFARSQSDIEREIYLRQIERINQIFRRRSNV